MVLTHVRHRDEVGVRNQGGRDEEVGSQQYVQELQQQIEFGLLSKLDVQREVREFDDQEQ